MPYMDLSPDAKLFYRDDNLTDPWLGEPEVALLLHGNAESSLAWNGWMPYLSRRLRVIRPDMRGFGQSTPMPLDYPWSIEGIVNDFIRLMDHLGIKRFHLAGAKIGGGISLKLAATHSDRVLTFTGCAARVRGREALGGQGSAALELIKSSGVETWARKSMPNRLGSETSPEMLEGWSKLMGATPSSTQIGFITNVPGIDVTDDLKKIECPVLLIGSERGPDGLSADSQRKSLPSFKHAELMVAPGDSLHIAVTRPDLCAPAMLAFIERNAVKA